LLDTDGWTESFVLDQTVGIEYSFLVGIEASTGVFVIVDVDVGSGAL
jgi:hypothetical protein